MPLKKRITEITGVRESEIPGSYQTIGDILLVKFPGKPTGKIKKKIAEACLKALKSVKSVYESKGITGELRKPSVKFLAGERNTKTMHREHGVLYSIDISKAMFSKGNLFERQRIIKGIKKGETVVDMFAGVGYFSLGISKFSGAGEVIAIEKSKDSFNLLNENIKLNRISKISTVLGDCRKISKMKHFQHIADRVIMGYFPGTEKFLPHAFDFLKEKGTIHYHDIFRERELWKRPEDIIRKGAVKKGYKIISMEKRKVKSFAPRIWHVALDVRLERK